MELPLVQAFALFAAISARYDREFTGPTYVEQDLMRRAALAAPGR